MPGERGGDMITKVLGQHPEHSYRSALPSADDSIDMTSPLGLEEGQRHGHTAHLWKASSAAG